MQNKDVDISNFTDGLDYLAKELDLPIPQDRTEQRKAFVLQLVDTLIRQ